MVKKYEEFINEIRFREVDDDGNDIKVEDRKENKLVTPKNKRELLDILWETFYDDNFDGDLNFIDTSKITDMRELFDDFQYNEKMYLVDVSKWDVSNVEDMSFMFYGCRDFDCDLSNWNVSNVKTMRYMFYECKSFNSDLSNWDVSNVDNMSIMFYNCRVFNSDLSKWDVSKVTSMHSMFQYCTKFNSDISNWNVSNVTDMWSMFSHCRNFSYKLDKWNVSQDVDVDYMFYACDSLNGRDTPIWYKKNRRN